MLDNLNKREFMGMMPGASKKKKGRGKLESRQQQKSRKQDRSAHLQVLHFQPLQNVSGFYAALFRPRVESLNAYILASDRVRLHLKWAVAVLEELVVLAQCSQDFGFFKTNQKSSNKELVETGPPAYNLWFTQAQPTYNFFLLQSQ